MDGWLLLWKSVLYGGLALFGAMSLWVIAGGFQDIKRMFVILREEASEDEA